MKLADTGWTPDENRSLVRQVAQQGHVTTGLSGKSFLSALAFCSTRLGTSRNNDMSFKLEHVILEDFDKISQHLCFDGGDLVDSLLSQLCWPVQDQQEASHRLRYYIHQQRQRFLLDATTRFTKMTPVRCLRSPRRAALSPELPRRNHIDSLVRGHRGLPIHDFLTRMLA